MFMILDKKIFTGKKYFFTGCLNCRQSKSVTHSVVHVHLITIFTEHTKAFWHFKAYVTIAA